MIDLAPAPVREVFHSRVRIAGGVRGSRSMANLPVRLPADMTPQASAPMRYERRVCSEAGDGPVSSLSRAAFPMVWEAWALTLGHIALASGSNL